MFLVSSLHLLGVRWPGMTDMMPLSDETPGDRQKTLSEKHRKDFPADSRPLNVLFSQRSVGEIPLHYVREWLHHADPVAANKHNTDILVAEDLHKLMMFMLGIHPNDLAPRTGVDCFCLGSDVQQPTLFFNLGGS